MTNVPGRAGALALIVTAVVCAGCAARGGVPRPFPGAPLPPGAGESAPPAPVPPATELPSRHVAVPPATPLAAVVSTALRFVGVPYRDGGSDPSGFDCSGFVQYVFARLGTVLPREVRDQFQLGREVDVKDVKPGDLLFFETVSRGASHVGMVVGGDQFVHAPSSRGVVRVERFTASYWAMRFVGARRVVGDVSIARR